MKEQNEERKNKIRVLHVSAGGLGIGGVTTVIMSIVEMLHDKIEFDCVVFAKRSEAESEFEKYGRIYRINCYPKNGKRDYFELVLRPIKLYFGILKICKNKSYDAIHCHNQRDAAICLLAAKHKNIPIRIVHSHVANVSKKKNMLEKIYDKICPIFLEKVSTHKVGCSKAACLQLYGKEEIIIRNSIDLNKFSSEKMINHEGINFIHVGRFNYAKNQEFLLEVFAEINKLLKNTKLLLVGYGDEKKTNSIYEKIRELQIQDVVEVVPGNEVNVIDYYKYSDFMIFPSRFEGFGIVLLEAQAMGITCYVSEIIQEEVDVGLLVFKKISDGPQKWAECIVNDINSNKQKYCNKKKLYEYDNKLICKQYERLYNDL